jgi:hypothetical protein
VQSRVDSPGRRSQPLAGRFPQCFHHRARAACRLAHSCPLPQILAGYWKYEHTLMNAGPKTLLAADQPQAPADLRDALRAIDRHVDDYITRARPGALPDKLDTNLQNLATDPDR